MTSIRRGLTWRLLTAVTALILLGGFALFLVARGILVGEFDAAQLTAATALMALAEQDSEGEVEFDLAPDLESRFGASAQPEYFQIWLEDGEVLARSESLGEGQLPRRAGPIELPEVWDLQLSDGRSGRAVGVEFVATLETDPDDEAAAPPSQSPPPPAPLVLVYARSRQSLDRVLGLMAFSLIALGLLLPLCVALLVWLTVGRGLVPLREISEEIRNLETDNLERRVPRDRAPEEIVPIVDRLNQLLARLDAAFKREKRFSSNVAHELRTPISELRALSEVALRTGADSDQREVYGDVFDIALQMERMVTSLLALSRAERGEETVHWESVDLIEILERCRRQHAKTVHERRLSVRFELPNRAPVRSDPALLGAVLSNLLGNAVFHSPPGSEVCCRLNWDGKGPILTLSNPSDTLRRSDLAYIFEPFWQKDASRANSERSGLGLAVAAEIAKLLRIKMTADLIGEDTFQLTLQFPTFRNGGESVEETR